MKPDLARALAGGFLAGDWTRPGLVASGARVVGRRRGWLGPLAEQVLRAYPRAPLDRPRELAGHLAGLELPDAAAGARAVVVPLAPTRMLTDRWHLPVLHDLADLAALLEVGPEDLDWFADPRRWARETSEPRLQHYRVSTRVAASGATRVLEAPKPRLRALQRRLLDRVVGLVPPHDAARGFRPGGSVASYAAPHAGRAVVLRLDLESFFAGVTVARVFGTWRSAGYPEPVAHALAGLMTTVLPRSTWQRVPRPADPALLDAHWRLGRRLAAPHLPQGAPTSPAVANLVAFGLDVRLSALARSWDARYTRYADDLALSCARPWGAGTARLVELVTTIARQEGFRVNPVKTAVMTRAGRQRLGGLVVNDRPRVSRAEVDLLRAVLHNCVLHGPSSQDRGAHPDLRSHLRGRVSWVAQHDPVRGARLLATYDAIDWSR